MPSVIQSARRQFAASASLPLRTSPSIEVHDSVNDLSPFDIIIAVANDFLNRKCVRVRCDELKTGQMNDKYQAVGQLIGRRFPDSWISSPAQVISG